MFATPSTRSLSTITALAAALLVAGCGGGGSSPEPAHDHDAHQHDDADDPSHHHMLPPVDAPLPLTPPLPSEAQQTFRQSGMAALEVTESIALASTYTGLIAGTFYNTPYWPVWYGNGKPVDGVNCLTSAKWHQHALISIYKDGKRLGFTDGIGRMHAGCYHAYEMHTHDVTGLVHMEAAVDRNFKLGQWFSLWQKPLSRDGVAGLAGPVRFYIIENGTITRYDGNPYDIPMRPRREILIVTGTPMTVVPRYQWPLGI